MTYELRISCKTVYDGKLMQGIYSIIAVQGLRLLKVITTKSNKYPKVQKALENTKENTLNPAAN